MNLSFSVFQNIARFGIVLVIAHSSLSAQTYSTLVYPSNGELVYAGYANEGQSTEGNLMIDFSYAGYMGGGVAIPWVPVVKTLHPDPNGGDDYARIQTAIDEMTTMGLASESFPGALLLKAGSYSVSETLRITNSGIVIRGEGQDVGGTVIRFTATVKDNLFEFVGGSGWSNIGGSESLISDTLVPSGTRSFNVDDATIFAVGDRVIVSRTPNQAWLTLLGMDTLSETDPTDEDWTTTAYVSEMPRTITAITGNTITIDAPIVHAIETQYGGGMVQKYTFNSIQQVGIEQLRLESTYANEIDEEHGWNAVVFERVENGWARQITARYFGYSCVNVVNECQHVTVEDCAQLDPKSLVDGSRRYSFNLDGSSFVLFQRCYARDGRHDYVTGSKTVGPNVFVDSRAEDATSDIGPHQRYAEGLLFDNVKGKAINVPNRLNSGSGHGWAGAQTVFWNCEADTLICDAPEAAMNFAIGCVGVQEKGSATVEADGIWESLGTPVEPASLYFQQLFDRLGETAYQSVTTPNQRQGRIWDDLASWQRERTALTTTVGAAIQLTAVAEHQVPSSPDSTTINGWSKLSGTGVATFGNASASTTTASFDQPGIYQLQYVSIQEENSVIYSSFDTATVYVSSSKNIFNPANFDSIGTISSSTPALSFDTDSLIVSGGLYGHGMFNLNDDGSLVAVFVFADIDLTTPPIIRGSLPIVIMSKGGLRVATEMSVKGGDGDHRTHGIGVAGGGDGGDAALDGGIYPFEGQGPGGSPGTDGTQNESITSGGGGFGGSGGDGTLSGGVAYGTELLDSLIGGSGAGGTYRKGGGAGGGGIGLVAAGDLEITSTAVVNARGGTGAPSDSQWTSGGGSGGAILLRGNNIILDGTLDVSGGNGGNASGGQNNGGGGGGGRIAVYYQNSFVENAGSSKTVGSGQPVGSDIDNQPGKAGNLGTIFINQLPAAVDDSDTTPKNTPITISVLSNDNDLDGGTITITEVTQGTNGVVTITNGNTTVDYTPNQDFGGNDSFAYTISDGNSTNTATVTVAVTSSDDTTAPAIPNDLVATAGGNSVALNWTANNENDLAGYSIYRSTVSGSYGAALATGLDAPEYVDNTAVNGTTYYYVVTAADINGNESDPGDEASATPAEDVTSPAAPTGLIATAADDSVSLNWDDNVEPDLARYVVYRSETAVSGYTAIDTNVSLSEYVDNTAVNCTAYYYVLTAVDSNGNESARSAGVSTTPQVATAVFGSNYNSLDGFTKSTTNITQESWSVEENSVRYINDDPDGGPDIGAEGVVENSSLLKAFALDRSVGKSYTIEGVIELTSGYADDNNRVGIYLFGDVNDLTDNGGPEQKETGALCLLCNFDDGEILLYEGIDRNQITGAIASTGRAGDDTIFGSGNIVTFTAEIFFLESGDIEIVGSLEYSSNDPDNNPNFTVTLPTSTVTAADYTGDYFGFATRARNQGVTSSNKDAPFIMDYKSFSITDCLTPVNPLPAAPSGLVATPGNSSVSLDWDDNTEVDLDSYTIYRSTTSGSYGEALKTGLTSSAFIDSPTANGTTYYYVVTALDSDGNESAPGGEVSVSSPIDSDGDFMADDWELIYFFSENAKDGSVDSDGDSVLDFFEHLYGSDPTLSSSSGFRFIASLDENGTDIVLSWEIKEGFELGQDYKIEYSTNLSTWDPLPEEHYSLTETTSDGKTKVELTLTNDYGSKVFLRLLQPTDN